MSDINNPEKILLKEIKLTDEALMLNFIIFFGVLNSPFLKILITLLFYLTVTIFKPTNLARFSVHIVIKFFLKLAFYWLLAFIFL